MNEFLLRDILLDKIAATALEPRQWELIIAQARSTRLLAALAIQLNDRAMLERLDPRIGRHLESELLVADKQQRDLRFDCELLRRALATADLPLILLKGGAYITAGLPVGRGRLITDIDIIVPADQLDASETALNSAGWASAKVSAYDDRYYRAWGHEIPPLYNSERGTTLDLHHNILPPTAGPSVNASLLFENLQPISPGVFSLGHCDMVIHSATHLFHEGEFHHGLRDLWDLDRMLRDFPRQDPNFWSGLLRRAEDLQLTVSLSHGLRYTQAVFNTPVPADVAEACVAQSMQLRRPLMDFLFRRAFRPPHPSCHLPLTGVALQLLYMRSHYLRMPIYMLLPHLARKAWVGKFGDKSDPGTLNIPG
ncbi:MAG: nucleotidyltransferase family protein [Pseudomonadota bacterium]